ncbi:MAG: hypothetical protein KKF50_04335 [Nanoarchaeota archaeon]|nr:hypothetical protein [Nanoarchaeota archaeon]
MERKGSALLIIAIILGSLAVVVVGTGVYFYEVHVFKEVRLCLGDPTDTNFSCSMIQDCLDKVEELQTEYNISELPKFAREKLEMLSDEAVYCEGTCKVKEVRGINFQTYELEDLESCDADETEVLIEIKGKEGLQIWDYMKGME